MFFPQHVRQLSRIKSQEANRNEDLEGIRYETTVVLTRLRNDIPKEIEKEQQPILIIAYCFVAKLKPSSKIFLSVRHLPSCVLLLVEKQVHVVLLVFPFGLGTHGFAIVSAIFVLQA